MDAYTRDAHVAVRRRPQHEPDEPVGHSDVVLELDRVPVRQQLPAEPLQLQQVLEVLDGPQPDRLYDTDDPRPIVRSGRSSMEQHIDSRTRGCRDTYAVLASLLDRIRG